MIFIAQQWPILPELLIEVDLRGGRRRHNSRKDLDLPDQKALLIHELIIICPVVQEGRKKSEKPVAVGHEDPLDGGRFVRVCNEDLLQHYQRDM